jgi:hypothetical protein
MGSTHLKPLPNPQVLLRRYMRTVQVALLMRTRNQTNGFLSDL